LPRFRAQEWVRFAPIVSVTSFVFNDFLASFPRFCVSHCRGNPCGCPWAATRAAPTGASGGRLAQTCSARSAAFAGWGGGAISSAPPGVSCPPPWGSPELFPISLSFASTSEALDFFLRSCISSSSRIFRSSCRCSAFCCRMVSAHCACEGAVAAIRAAREFSTCSYRKISYSPSTSEVSSPSRSLNIFFASWNSGSSGSSGFSFSNCRKSLISPAPRNVGCLPYKASSRRRISTVNSFRSVISSSTPSIASTFSKVPGASRNTRRPVSSTSLCDTVVTSRPTWMYCLRRSRSCRRTLQTCTADSARSRRVFFQISTAMSSTSTASSVPWGFRSSSKPAWRRWNSRGSSPNSIAASQ